jgi:hypothetical protein
MSIGHMSAEPFPRWTVAFVASRINHISRQAAAVMSKAGWPVSIDDVIVDRIVRDGFGSDEERNVRSERNGGQIG